MKWILIFSVVFIVSCSNSKKVQDEVSSQEKLELLTEDTISLSFERTICYGACPAYKITVKNDGSCQYEGYKFTDRIGKFTATISKSQFEEIQNEAKKIGFFSMKEKYDATVTDVPSIYIMLVGPNGAKQVEDRFDAPKELKNFEEFIDSILLKLDWKSQE